MKRRDFLKLMGGGVVLAAGGATAWATTRTPQAALEPWALAGTYSDARMRALSHAILAPNPHNRQPWIVDLKGDDAAVLYFDTDRQLPETDPFDRQLTIGLGCFLELLRMAAQADGYRADIALFPDGYDAEALDTRPVANITFTLDPGLAEDPLWAFVPQRRSLKEPYDTERPVSPETLSRVLAAGRTGAQIGGTVEADNTAYWRKLTEDALMVELEYDPTYHESVELFRIGKAEVNANPDGIDFTGPLFEGLGATGLFSREAAMDRNSVAYTSGIDALSANCQTAMGFVWMVTATNTREDQIAAGADWLHVNLATTREGLGFQPMSQALQEYPQMAALYDDTHTRLAPDGGTVQMLARIGYGPDVPPSPRWPIDAKVRTA